MILEKLKNWTNNVINCIADINLMSEETADGQFDPRELPRPLKMQNNFSGDQKCKCHNCLELAEAVMECPICLETFGNNSNIGIATCDDCANVICNLCALKLTNCPFCRSQRSLQQNTPLEKLLSKLHLPCSIPRSETKKIIKKEELVLCPVRSHCPWQGRLNAVGYHLETKHSVPHLTSDTLAVEITSFRKKTLSSHLRCKKYLAALEAYGSLFITKISLHERKLQMVFAETSSNDHCVDRYAAWLEITSPIKTIKAIMPVSSNSHKFKQLQISCNTFISPWKQHLPEDDKVKIYITIRPFC